MPLVLLGMQPFPFWRVSLCFCPSVPFPPCLSPVTVSASVGSSCGCHLGAVYQSPHVFVFAPERGLEELLREGIFRMRLLFGSFPYKPRCVSCSLYSPSPFSYEDAYFSFSVAPFPASGCRCSLWRWTHPVFLLPQGEGPARGPAERTLRAGCGEHFSLPAHVLIQNVAKGPLALLDGAVWVMGLGSSEILRDEISRSRKASHGHVYH